MQNFRALGALPPNPQAPQTAPPLRISIYAPDGNGDLQQHQQPQEVTLNFSGEIGFSFPSCLKLKDIFS